jgi:Cu-Zn family superoxide dismutase
MWKTIVAVAAGLSLSTGVAQAAEVRAQISLITPEGIGQPIGAVRITDAAAGAKLVTELRRLPPGEHGFQLHTNGDCGPGPDGQGAQAAGMAAGEPWHPAGAPSGEAPFIFAGADGSAVGALIIPGIDDVTALAGRSLVILANRRDGARIACGVIG